MRGSTWRGSGEAARLGFLDCLALARQVGDQFNVAEALAGLSTLAARDGYHADAARLAGASAAISERFGAPPWESLVAIHEARRPRPAKRSAPTPSRRSTPRARGWIRDHGRGSLASARQPALSRPLTRPVSDRQRHVRRAIDGLCPCSRP